MKDMTVQLHSIEEVLGRALVDADFQEKLFSEPNHSEEEFHFDEADIKLLNSLNPETFAAFRERLNAQLMKEPGIIIFCSAY